MVIPSLVEEFKLNFNMGQGEQLQVWIKGNCMDMDNNVVWY